MNGKFKINYPDRYLNNESEPSSKKRPSQLYKPSGLLYADIIALGSAVHTEHKNIFCGQNVEFLNFKTGGE